MCGISGIFNLSGEPVSRNAIMSMMDTLIHRGPDEEGVYLSGPVGLGHRRLSIIDLQSGHQPMSNEDGTVWVVFNGEIYNFQELHDRLQNQGHIFRTRSDTEVIVHLYEQEGERCFEHLRGMFAIAIWDARTRRLLLARDRVGKKPLFYYFDGRHLLFASEMKAILAVCDLSLDLDLEAISDYFSFLYIPAPKSIFKQIRKVLPGHYLVCTETDLREVEYWDLHFHNTINVSEEEWCERILEAYREAVRIRLISEVPLGAFLSGGVDSSSVVALMSEYSRDPVITSSIGFEEKEFDELNYARLVANKFLANHYEEIVRPDAVNIIEKLVWHYDEPFADSSAVPTYYVSKVARQRVTVALSGDGGDENLAGYRRYYFDKRENHIRSLFSAGFRKWVFGSLAALYPKADWAPRIFRGKATLHNLAGSHIEGYFRSMSAWWPEWKARLLTDDVQRSLNGYESVEVLRRYYDKADTEDLLSRIQYVDIKTYLTDDILVKVDRASMAHSLEVRAPILDHRFMELLAMMPSSMKLRGTVGKYIFKKALETILPHEVLYRNKMGFGVPIAKWFRNDLKDMAYHTIVEAKEDGVLNGQVVKQIWNDHQSGLRDRSTELWTLLMFRSWQRIYRK